MLLVSLIFVVHGYEKNVGEQLICINEISKMIKFHTLLRLPLSNSNISIGAFLREDCLTHGAYNVPKHASTSSQCNKYTKKHTLPQLLKFQATTNKFMKTSILKETQMS